MISGRPSEPKAKLRVLVIEDDEDCQHFVREVLRSAGYAVDVARDGFEGIARAAGYRYDLIVCDVAMPHLSGLDVMREIRSVERREARSKAPLIALTVYGDSDIREHAVEIGIDEVLEKPMRAQALIQASRRVIDDCVNVLVVDADGERTAQLEAWCAARPKTRLIKAVCSADACVRLNRERVDLVLVHVATDGVDGHAAARLLRADGERGLLPIIAFAEHFDDATRLRCLSNGYTDCFRKALTRDAFGYLLDVYGNRPDSSSPVIKLRTPRALMSAPAPAPSIAIEDEDVRALLPQFLRNLGREIETVRGSLLGGVFTSSVRVGHNLKGTGTSYGFPGISGLGAQLESAGQRGDVLAAVACLDALGVELERGKARLK